MKKRFRDGFLLKSCLPSLIDALRARNSGWRNTKIQTVKKHLNKYLDELKLHFDLSNEDIQKLLMITYDENKPSNPFLKCLSMIKYWN